MDKRLACDRTPGDLPAVLLAFCRASLRPIGLPKSMRFAAKYGGYYGISHQSYRDLYDI
jgi:hypothetical protein